MSNETEGDRVIKIQSHISTILSRDQITVFVCMDVALLYRHGIEA